MAAVTAPCSFSWGPAIMIVRGRMILLMTLVRFPVVCVGRIWRVIEIWLNWGAFDSHTQNRSIKACDAWLAHAALP